MTTRMTEQGLEVEPAGEGAWGEEVPQALAWTAEEEEGFQQETTAILTEQEVYVRREGAVSITTKRRQS